MTDKQQQGKPQAQGREEKDPFIEKHLAIIKQKTKDLLIDQHIGKMWGSLSTASIKYFLETGTINGGFREHLLNLMDAWKKYKLDEPASSIPTEVQKPDCSQHKKEIAGIRDMKVLAEMIGDLHYDSLFGLFNHLHLKIKRDAIKDDEAGRTKLAECLYSVADSMEEAANSTSDAYEISKPFMKETHASSAPPISHKEKFTLQDFFDGVREIVTEARDWWHRLKSVQDNIMIMKKYFPNEKGSPSDEMIVNMYLSESEYLSLISHKEDEKY